MSTEKPIEAWQQAVSLLARRDHTEHEIVQKLIAKGYSQPTIQQVLSHLIEAGYLNDHRVAENYIRAKQHRGYGPLRIQLELQARGISDEIIAEQLQIKDNAWQAEASKVWQKQFKGQRPKDFKTKAKQMRFLQYRGFTLEQIESVLKSYDN